MFGIQYFMQQLDNNSILSDTDSIGLLLVA